MLKGYTIIIKTKPIPEPEYVMHNKPCKNCPSAHHLPDPEAIEISNLPHGERVKHAFPCGWNGKKFCRGYCDQNNITNEDLQKLKC